MAKVSVGSRNTWIKTEEKKNLLQSLPFFSQNFRKFLQEDNRQPHGPLYEKTFLHIMFLTLVCLQKKKSRKKPFLNL